MTLRRAARVDANQSEVVDAFKRMGCSVLIIAQLKNCCDLIVAHGQTAAVEIKDGSLPPSARVLSDGEAKFRASWRGKYYIVESVDDAIRVAQELRA